MVDASLIETLIDQYKVEQHLGDTPFTQVYLAYDVDNDQYVSLHILRPEVKQDAQIAAQFLNRAKALAQVRHPNIARVYQVDTTPEGLPYVAQAYFEGLSLAQRLEQLVERPTPVNSLYAIKIVRQLADALKLAERLALWHHDLQPENIRLKNVTLPTDETVVLMDLFLPAGKGATLPAERNGGSAAFLSPEQRTGKDVTSSSHVYSLGALLFRLLGGQLPPRPVSLVDTTIQNFFGRTTALARIRPELTPELIQLVDRSLRRDPGQRYRTMADFMTSLDGALVAEESRLSATAEITEEKHNRLMPVLLPVLIAGLILLAGAFFIRQFGAWPVAANEATGMPTMAPTSVAPVISPTESVISLEPVPTGTKEADRNVMLLEATTITPENLPILSTDSPQPSPTLPPTATLSPTPQPTNTPSSTPEALARVAFNTVNLRRGPGVVYSTIGTVESSDVLKIIAWNADNLNPWYLILTEDGRQGWIAATVVEPIDEAAQAIIPPAATIPPAPTLTATPSPTPLPQSAQPSPTIPVGGGGEPQPTSPPPKPPPEPTATPPPLP